jgi:signal transduction histidine kinase
VRSGHPLLKPVAIVVILVMAAVAALGFHSIRKDVENLRIISRDNIVWSATQLELEFLRFQRSLAFYVSDPSEAARDDVQQRFDILWSRFNLFSDGRVGRLLRQYDDGNGTVQAITQYLEGIDGLIAELSPADAETILTVLPVLDAFQSDLRQYSLRVVRGDTAAASAVRERMLASSQLTGYIALAAMMISALSLFLIMRDNRRQREIAALSREKAEAAENASRAKSHFLTMMSHELRNPLNGVMGPLALVSQSDVGPRQIRLIAKAQASGRVMLRMLSGLLDYGDIEDGRLVLREEALRIDSLAEQVRGGLQAHAVESSAAVEVSVAAGGPGRIWGDLDRLSRIFLHLGEHLLGPDGAAGIRITFSHDGRDLVGEIAVAEDEERVAWKLDLLMGLAGTPGGAFATESLGPVVARGILAAAQGVLTIGRDAQGRRVVRVAVPARPVDREKIRVHLHTRSMTLEALYRAALRCDQTEFVDLEGDAAADLILVDNASIRDDALVRSLRSRFPGALLVSLGAPPSPDVADEVVDAPTDVARLRASVLGRFAS